MWDLKLFLAWLEPHQHEDWSYVSNVSTYARSMHCTLYGERLPKGKVIDFPAVFIPFKIILRCILPACGHLLVDNLYVTAVTIIYK